MQLAASRIRTRVTVTISYDNNHYTTGTCESLRGDARFGMSKEVNTPELIGKRFKG